MNLNQNLIYFSLVFQHLNYPELFYSIFIFLMKNHKLLSYGIVLNQCCEAGAGGAEIILGPGVGAENKF